ncbi:MAG: VWA domain-containing protein, partial [Acidobacteriota bacterium]
MPPIRTIPTSRRLPSVFAVAAIAALGAALWIAPTGRVAAQESTFEGVADVVEVQVPVNVFTRDGEPVRGLTVEDFEVLDRGTKQRITGFDVVDLEVLRPDTLGGPDALEAAIPGAARRHFLLLFDLTFATPSSVVKARRAAREFVLRELHPTDLAAVATFSMDVGPQLLVTFTPDRAQLARAITTLGAPRLLEQQGAVDPLRFMIDDPARSAISSTFNEGELGEGQFAGMDQEVQAYLKVVAKQMGKWEKSYQRGRVSSWVASLEGMADALGSVDGRKHVVFFSEGFDGRLMFGRGPDPQDEAAQEDRRNLDFNRSFMVDSDDIYGNTALQQQVSGALETFRRADCVIQAVDISGLGSDSAEHRRAHTVGQDALFYMANETGGTLFEDTNDLGSELDEVLARSSVTYLLSFEPSDLERDGSYHRLEIRLAGDRKARLSHREGYFAPRPFEDLHPLEKSLLASDAIASAAPRRELDLNVLAAPFRANEARAYVPVIIEVDGDKLLKGHAEDQPLSAEFYTYVSDGEGRMRDFFSQMATLNLTGDGRDAMRATGVKYYGHLDLEPGEYLVRVLVRNASTGRTGVESVP